jgi:H/ACA ribonucleoprotein complex subunit 4
MEELLPFEKAEREVLVRHKSKTNPGYGGNPEERTVEELIIYGIININKPSGPTSHQVSDSVQKILGIKKSGHSGTLDPRVTGVLPIATGKATRIVQTLLTAGKEYVCIMHLHDSVPEEKIRETVKEFTGTITQLPPIKSAVKRQERERTIYYFNILEIKEQDVLFKVGCEAGTYIRKICHDFGQKLGVGAHMAELVRTKAGPFNDESWVTLHDLKDAYELWKEGDDSQIRRVIQPVEFAVSHLPKIWVADGAVDTICHGANLSTPGIAKLHSNINQDDTVAVMTLKDELICLGEAKMNSQNMFGQERGIAVKTKKVFMDRGTYPKFKKK